MAAHSSGSPVAAPGRTRLRPIVLPALDGLRMYPGSAFLIGALGAGALAVTLPVLWLAAWRDGQFLTRLGLDPVAAGPLLGPYAEPAGMVQQRGLRFFFLLLAGVAGGTVAVAALAALGLAAARASQRTLETGVRRALGASRGALVAALALEGALLAAAVMAGGAGLALLLWAVSASWPGGMRPVSPGAAVLLALALALLLVLGMVLPVVFARRQPLGRPEARPVPLVIPALQLGLSIIALGAGSALAQHAAHLFPPADASASAAAVYRLTARNPDPVALAGHYRALLGRLAPTVESLSLATPGAVLGLGSVNRITTDCGRCSDGGLPMRFRRVTVTQQVVSADSFRALGAPLVRGRSFAPADSMGAAPVALVSRSLALAHFQNGEPIGRRFRLQASEPPGPEGEEWYTVIGVVDDRRAVAFGAGSQPVMTIYLNQLQHPTAEAELLVRERPGRTGPAVDLAITQSFGADAIAIARLPMAALLAREARRFDWFAAWFSRLGWAMLGIALVGLVTLMRGWVASLSRELGLRRAVGARRRQLLALVLGRAAVVGLAGAGLGLWFGPAVWQEVARAMGAQAAGESPPLPGLSLLLVGAAILGAAAPAWRAGAAPPAELLGAMEE